MIVLWGPSQMGKTSFINDLTLPGQGPALATGDGSGDSTTDQCEARRTEIGFVLDGPGVQDSRIHITNQEVGDLYVHAIAQHGKHEAGEKIKLLVFESLCDSKRELRMSLASLQQAFCPQVLPAVVVLASKADLVNAEMKNKRLNAIKEIMTSNGIDQSRLVEWQHVATAGASGKDVQLKQLKAALGQAQLVTPGQLQSIWLRQERRAKELCRDQPPRFEPQMVMKPKIRTKLETEYYSEPEEYSTDEEKSEYEWTRRDEGTTVVGGLGAAGAGAMLGMIGGPVGMLLGGTLGGVLGGTAGHAAGAPERQRRTVTVRVKKTRWVRKKKQVSKSYQDGYEQVEIKVPVRLNEADFASQALSQILQERLAFAARQRVLN